MTDQADQAGGTAWADEPGSPGPNVARIDDYLLGGKDQFAADRQAAQRLIAALPDAPYVDRDLTAVRQAQALLPAGGEVIAFEGDAREPGAIMASPALAGVIDLARPVCLLLVSMLHFVTAAEADMIVGTFRERMVPGSYLVISQGHAGPVPREPVQDAYGSRVTLTGRTAAEIAAYFDGFDLVPPGLVPVGEWPAAQPGMPPPLEPASAVSPQAAMLAGVGRKVFPQRGG